MQNVPRFVGRRIIETKIIRRSFERIARDFLKLLQLIAWIKVNACIVLLVLIRRIT